MNNQAIASTLSWCFDENEEIAVVTDDGVPLKLLCTRSASELLAPSAHALEPDGCVSIELIPRFRYRLRLQPLRPADFQAEAARALLHHGLLLLPSIETAEPHITELIALSFNMKVIRLVHGSGLEARSKAANPASARELEAHEVPAAGASHEAQSDALAALPRLAAQEGVGAQRWLPQHSYYRQNRFAAPAAARSAPSALVSEACEAARSLLQGPSSSKRDSEVSGSSLPMPVTSLRA